MFKRSILSLLGLLAVVTASHAQDGELRYAKAGRYTYVPDGQQGPITMSATIRNLSGVSLNSAVVNVIVLAQGNPVPVYNQSTTATNVPGNDSVNVVLPAPWTPPAGPQNYQVIFDLNSPNDINPTNDGVTRNFRIDPVEYRRDDDLNSQNVGADGGNIRQGQQFTVNSLQTLTEVQVYTNGGNVGDTLSVEVYSMVGTLPGSLLYSTPNTIITNNAAGFRTFTFTVPPTLTVGEYLVVMRHGVSVGPVGTSNIGQGMTAYNNTPNEAWLRIGNGAWSNPASFGFPGAYQLRIKLGTPPAQDLAYNGRASLTSGMLRAPLYELGQPQLLGARVRNNGNATANNIMLTARVFALPNVTSPVFTATSTTLASLVAGNTASLTTTTGWVPTANGNYLIRYTFGMGAEVDTSNNVGEITVRVGPNEYARDNDAITGSLGIDDVASTVGVMGQNFRFAETSVVDSIRFYWQNPIAGDQTKVLVFNTVAGTIAGNPVQTPSAQIDSSAIITASATPGWYTVQLLAPLTVTGGNTIFVGLKEQSAEILGVGTTNDLFSTYGMWVAWTGQNWAPLSNFAANLQRAFAVRVYAHTTCTTASPTVMPTNLACAGDGTGSVELNFGVDTTGWTYSWSNGATTQDIFLLDTGTYSVSIITAPGCTTAAGPFVLTEPSVLSSSANSTNPATGSSQDGTADVDATGGTPPYSYTWVLGGDTVGTTDSISNLGPGTYNVTVADANGCTSTQQVTLTATSALAETLLQQVSLYPNPTRGAVQVQVNGTEAVQIRVVATTGQVLLEVGTLQPGTHTVDVSLLPPGAYLVQLQNTQGTATQRLVRQ